MVQTSLDGSLIASHVSGAGPPVVVAVPFLLALLPWLAGRALAKIRAAAGRSGKVPDVARSPGALLVAAAVALPWLPAAALATTVATWFLAIVGGLEVLGRLAGGGLPRWLAAAALIPVAAVEYMHAGPRMLIAVLWTAMFVAASVEHWLCRSSKLSLATRTIAGSPATTTDRQTGNKGGVGTCW